MYRIYSAEGLSIRKRKKTKRIGVRVPLVAALAVNQTWSLDFVSDAIARPDAISQRITRAHGVVEFAARESRAQRSDVNAPRLEFHVHRLRHAQHITLDAGVQQARPRW